MTHLRDRDHRGRLLGGCGPHAGLGARRLEIGYWVDVRHTRRGVATLASAALTELATTIPELTVVEIHPDQANLASAAVPPNWAMGTWQPAATLRCTRRDRHRVAMADEPGRLAEQPGRSASDRCAQTTLDAVLCRPLLQSVAPTVLLIAAK